MHTLPDNLAQTLRDLAAFCAARGVAAWLVGGAARDLALGHTPYDLDVAVDADGVALARAFADQAGAAFVALDDERGTGRVVFTTLPERLIVDLVQLRAPTLEADLRLRDFTVNAMAHPLEALGDASALHDPCGGLTDLAAGHLRPCSPTSLRDDPLRILRALRLAAKLDLRIAPDLDAALRMAAPLIANVAAERVRDELLRLLALPHATPWLHYMDAIGVLTRIIPELEPARACAQPSVHFLPVLAHTLETVTAVEWLLGGIFATPNAPAAVTQPVAVQTHPDLTRALPYTARLRDHLAAPVNGWPSRATLLKLAALLHDNAKPQTRQIKTDGGISFYGHQQIGAAVAVQIGRRLRLSRAATEYIALVVREHMRPGQLRTAEQVTLRAIVRFFRDTAGAGPDVLVHELADHLATRGPQLDPAAWAAHLDWVGALLDVQWGQLPERTAPLIDGHDLMKALGIGPGKRVGELLREIHEAQAAGEISTRDDALALARRLNEPEA